MAVYICSLTFMCTLWTTGNVYSSHSVPDSCGSNQTLTDSFHAISDILTSQLATSFRVPSQYHVKSSSINLYYEPLQILKVDEIFQAITVSSTVTLTWKDLNLGWDAVNFTGIESIEMPVHLFWTPSVLVPKATYKNALQLRMPDSLCVSFDGQITAYISTLINSLCNFDMTKFPFDSHNCSIVFLERDFYNLSFQILPSRNISKNFGTNSAWILQDYGCSTTTTHSAVSLYPPFDYITCYVQMNRRSAFFAANLIGPMVLTSLMTLVVFWIPAEEGEKISFLVSIFTSTSVFLNYIVDLFPPSMESLPRLNFLLFAIDFQVILTTVATAFVLRRYKQEEKRQHNQHKQIPSRVNLFWRHERKEAPTQNMAPQQRVSKNSVLNVRSNIVYPETASVKHFKTPTNRSQNKVTRHTRGPDTDIYEECHDNDITGNRGDYSVKVDEPPEYKPSKGNRNKKECLWNRSLTHQELDMLFFVLMLLLTIAVYLYTFLG